MSPIKIPVCFPALLYLQHDNGGDDFKILVIGGSAEQGVLDFIQVYDYVKDMWLDIHFLDKVRLP